MSGFYEAVGVGDSGRFCAMVSGLKERNALAFAQFCDWFEGFLQQLVRWELSSRRVSWVDPADICQEVLLGFWEVCPRLIFEGAPAIRRYLARMARTKILDQLRHSRAACRDVRRTERVDIVDSEVLTIELDPQELMILREFLDRAGDLLNERQKQICEWRCANVGWNEIANRLGASVESVQKQLQRAIDVISDDVHRDDSAYVPRRTRAAIRNNNALP